MTAYQSAYRRLFTLTMAGGWHSLTAVALRQQMDAMAGSNEDKIAWGVQIGSELYLEVIGC